MTSNRMEQMAVNTLDTIRQNPGKTRKELCGIMQASPYWVDNALTLLLFRQKIVEHTVKRPSTRTNSGTRSVNAFFVKRGL